MIPYKQHICVCICTYKRSELLRGLLSKLDEQGTEGFFEYSIVIVDNDSSESARQTVESFALQSKISVSYYIEPEQNIALARNMAVNNANSDFIAFIDDDEYPDGKWLYHLYKASTVFKADGILGPVIPHFDSEPPQWIVKGRICERKSFETGKVIKNYSDTRTGNVLLNKSLFRDNKNPFDPRRGRTGGEDTDFFKRMMERGKILVWCNEALVWEHVPKERMEKGYFLRRALLRGFVNSRDVSIISMATLKSLIAFILYTVGLPFCLIIGQHVFMKYLIKNCDHIGKLLGLFGWNPMVQRSF